MRGFFTIIMAFFLSFFAGGTAVVAIAEATKAREEFILVFLVLMIVIIIAASVFAFALARWGTIASVHGAGRWLLVGLGVMVVALLVLTVIDARSRDDIIKSIPLLVGIALPSFIVIAVQWLFVRWRLRRRPSEPLSA